MRAIKAQVDGGRLQRDVAADFRAARVATISKIARGLHVHQRAAGGRCGRLGLRAMAEVTA